jgi:hypothetical protein
MRPSLDPEATLRIAPSKAAVVLALVLPAAAAAQDAHYWTYGYGPVGQLTVGTLVGGVGDLSAVYYNPGALALIDDPRFVIGLSSVELTTVDVPGAAGENLDVDQLVFDIVPPIVAGRIGGGKEGANRFAFAFLSRHDTDWDMRYMDPQVTAASPDGSAAYGRARQRLVEYWLGGTWSRRLSPTLSLGVSPFLAYRAQRTRRYLAYTEVEGGTSRSSFVGTEYEYNHGRALAKAGLAWRPRPWELGLTVTTPGVPIVTWGGKAVFQASDARNGQAPFLSASTQKDLQETYHSPWSVAAGATWRRPRGAIHSTVEWFSAVSAYDILDPEPAPVAGSAQTVPLGYRGEGRSIVNLGFGLEQRLGERFVLYGGAALNQSAWVAERDSFASWDLKDVSAGATYDRGRARFALGVRYTWGSDEIPQAVAPPGETLPTRKASISAWTISAGASFGARPR